ncbi:MAG: DUF5813 family protein [Haloarculaceae archaeon]
MTDDVPDRAARALDAHDAFERTEGGFEVTTIAFDNRVTATETDDWALEYRIVVRTPTLSAATADDVGPAVEEGWFDTFARRLEDAPSATRADVALGEDDLRREGHQAVATLAFPFGNADRAPDVAKALVEYVEGTYVEGVVPGYDYQPPVSDLLEGASQAGGGSRGGTPL